jgi:hypothetical protein
MDMLGKALRREVSQGRDGYKLDIQLPPAAGGVSFQMAGTAHIL